MTARNDDDRRPGERDGGGEYDGMDALMAVLAEEPLPEAARRDQDFMSAHDSAAADVDLLRRQLGLLGDALARAGEARAGAEAGGPAGRTAQAEMVDGPPAASAASPGAAAGSPVTSPSTRRPARAKPLAVALKGLVAAVGATVVIGTGWLVVQSGGAGAGDDQGGKASAADDSSASLPRSGEGAGASHAGYLACARLVVEGTVTEVEAVPGTGQDRVTLEVERYYKPAEGRDRVVFPMGSDVEPRLRPGDHVLVGISRGQAEPDLWTAGEKEIARDRAWITAGLPRSRTFPCR